MPPPSPEIAASGSPGSTRMAMKMSSVTPKSVGTAMSRRWARYLRMGPLRRRLSSPARSLRYRSSQKVSTRPSSEKTRASLLWPLTLFRHIGRWSVNPMR